MDNKKIEYNYLSEPIKDVMANIEKYIIPENRSAIRYLWSKNILTVMTNNYENDDSWISLGELSEENYSLFYELLNSGMDKNIPHVELGWGRRLVVPIVPGSVADMFEYFKPLIDLFQYQDVQKDGYMTEEEFLMKYENWWEIVPNPEYRYIEKSEYYSFDEMSELLNVPKKIKVFKEPLEHEPLEYYLRKHNFIDYYDEKEGKIFYNKELYEGHINYKIWLKKNKHI